MPAKTIKGTKGADALSGSNGDDVIYGLNGNDTIVAGGGNDLVDGGAGDDSIDGGLGNDSLFGGLGNDTIVNHDGSNLVYGGTGDDNIDLSASSANTIYGDGYDSFKLQGGALVPIDLSTSPGADTISGGNGSDTIYGDDGNNLNGTGVGGADIIHGNDGADAIYGEGGNDQIFGDAGDDQLFGGSGDDTLIGGPGNDVLTGGAGNDVIDGGVYTGTFPDTDTANYLVAGVTTGVNVNLSTHTATDGMGGTDTLQNIDRVVGTQFADVLIGGDPANAGNNGMEIFEGRGGNDTIIGAAGYNTWAEYRDAASGVIVDLNLGQASNDGDGGVDTLVNVNRVRGSAFDDQIYGSNNPTGTAERFEGMAGNDLIDGRGGFDVVHYTSSPSAVTVDLLAGTASDGFGTTDTLLNIEGVRGSNFDDTLIGSNSSGLETFEGMAGNDNIDGQGGPDRIEFNRSPSGVVVDMGTGIAHDGFGGTDHFINIEAVRGSLFNDSLIGGTGDDSLDGGAGDDTLISGLGNDSLFGGDGNDTFIYTIGTGTDTINGGAGYDTLTVFGTAGNDTVNIDLVVPPAPQIPPFGLGAIPSVDFLTVDLGSGIDTLNYAGSGQNVTAVLGGTASGGNTSGHIDLLLNVENLTGGDGNDSLTGDANANRLDGGGGISDTLSGGGGDDTLIGGLGNDSLLGGDGNDIFLYGVNDGSDIVDGGNGNDTLAISGTSGNDSLNVSWSGGVISQIAESGSIVNIETVTLDLGAGNDTLSYFTNAGVVATVGGSASGFNGTIAGVENLWGGNGNDLLTGDGGANLLKGGPGDDTLSGGDGNDTLSGGGGEDALWGGAGDDTILYAFDTPDAINGGDGTDTLVVTGSNADETLEIEVTGGLISKLGWQLVTGIENATLDMGDGNDTLNYAGSFSTSTEGVTVVIDGYASGFTSPIVGVDNVISGSGNDSLTGNNNDNFLASGSGSDTLYGGGGNDMLKLIGDGTDVINGGDGYDTLQIYGTDDLQGVHVLWSGSGVISGIGNGGAVTDVEAVTLTLSGGGVPYDTLSYDGTVADLSVTLGGNASGFTSPIIGVENVIGGSGNDAITGDDVPVANSNSFAGGAGNDTLDGGAGFDTLSGGVGNDILKGGADDDILTGGQGSDSLNGGAGADTFKWDAGDEGSGSVPVDTIADFDQTANSDKLDLKDLLTGEHYGVNGSPSNLDTFLSFHFDGADTTINVSTTSGAPVSQQIVLQGVDITSNNNLSASAIIQDLLGAGKLITDA